MKASADPNLIVYFDGKYMPLRDAQVNILTHALHYGTGVFEGIRAHGSRPKKSCSSCARASTTSGGRKTVAFCASKFRPA